MFGAGIPPARCLHGNVWNRCELCPPMKAQTVSPVQMMPITAKLSTRSRLGFKDDDKLNPRGK